MPDAWETLIANSALPSGDAWEHLNAQQGGGGGDVIVSACLGAEATPAAEAAVKGVQEAVLANSPRTASVSGVSAEVGIGPLEAEICQT